VQNWIEIVLFALIIGSSAVGWLVRKLKEQAEVRQHQAGLERQRLDALRTGRNLETLQAAPGASPTMADADSSRSPVRPPARPMTAEERLREIMAERQRRLEELRRRAQAQTQAQSKTAPPTATQARSRAPLQPSGGPPISQAQAQANARAKARMEQARAAQARAAQAKAVQQRPSQPSAQSSRGITLNTSDGAYTNEQERRDQIARKRAEAEREGAIARTQQDNYERSERDRVDRERAAATIADSARRGSPVPAGPRLGAIAATPVIADASRLSPGELRKAIIMSEILSPPRSMRDDL
jgi:hypothetical protein